MPMMAASDNPFERVMLKKVTGTIRVTPEARDAQILEVNVPKNKYRPGDTIHAFVTYKPFRSRRGDAAGGAGAADGPARGAVPARVSATGRATPATSRRASRSGSPPRRSATCSTC